MYQLMFMCSQCRMSWVRMSTNIDQELQLVAQEGCPYGCLQHGRIDLINAYHVESTR